MTVLSLLLLFLLGLTSLTLTLPVVDPKLETNLKQYNYTHIRIIFVNDNNAKLHEQLKSRKTVLLDRGDDDENKHDEIHTMFKKHADDTQKDTQAALDQLFSKRNAGTNKAFTTQLYLLNHLFVFFADQEILELLKERGDVAKLESETGIPNPFRNETQTNDTSGRSSSLFPKPAQHPWNMRDIAANDFWKRGKGGQGAVIGVIDTGVNGDHKAFTDTIRSTHGWFDPVDRKETPHDPDGHGTMVAGIISSQNNFAAVAIKAKLIACRIVHTYDVTDFLGMFSIQLCMQFMECPTGPLGEDRDCRKKPNAVCNSWGNDGNKETPAIFREFVGVWRSKNIVPIFSVGNNGPQCGTVTPPGWDEDVIGVGAYDYYEKVSTRSGRGPPKNGNRIKPDVVAPGVDIYTVSGKDKESYVLASGTSFAAPHVAGFAAMYFSEKRRGTVENFETILRKSARKLHSQIGCNGEYFDDVYPNNDVGYGKINAIEFRKQLRALGRNDDDGAILLPSIRLIFTSFAFLITVFTQQEQK